MSLQHGVVVLLPTVAEPCVAADEGLCDLGAYDIVKDLERHASLELHPSPGENLRLSSWCRNR